MIQKITFETMECSCDFLYQIDCCRLCLWIAKVFAFGKFLLNTCIHRISLQNCRTSPTQLRRDICMANVKRTEICINSINRVGHPYQRLYESKSALGTPAILGE